jgi:hypothetical protein
MAGRPLGDALGDVIDSVGEAATAEAEGSAAADPATPVGIGSSEVAGA